jgi:Rieske 2Fe-2S family protein
MHANPHANDDSFHEIRKAVSKANHAPGWVYSSPEVLQREIDEVFMRDWLYVGRVEEVAKPGDYMTMRLVGQPVVISRDRQGELHASYNMCVHRGVTVAQGNGNTNGFVCPYHGWTYDLSGRLRTAAHMKESEGFDVSKCRLKQIAMKVWHGNIFLSFAQSPPDFTTYIKPFEAVFGPLQMERCRLGQKLKLELDCNWKLFHENLLDFYHVRVLHAGTFGAGFRWDNNAVALNDDGSITMEYKAGPPTPKAEPLLGKMPWLENEEFSYASTGILPPNFAIFGRIDCARPMVAWPNGPDKCEVIIYHLFPEEFHERLDFAAKLEIYKDYQFKVLEEDRSMIEAMQKTMPIGAYRPGRLSIYEKAVHHYINHHLDRIYPAGARQEAAQ